MKMHCNKRHMQEQRPRNVNTTTIFDEMFLSSRTQMLKWKYSWDLIVCPLTSMSQPWRGRTQCFTFPYFSNSMEETGWWVIYFAHKSFMVVLTQPVMQIHGDWIKFENPYDSDVSEPRKINFLRQQGFTAWELLTIPPGHEVFGEDTLLKEFTSRMKDAVNRRITLLLKYTFPEEQQRAPQVRMNRRRVICDYLQNKMRKVGESPRGDQTRYVAWAAWAASPGGAASKLW